MYMYIDNSVEMKYQFSMLPAIALKTRLIEFLFILWILNVDISSYNPISSNSSFVHTYVRTCVRAVIHSGGMWPSSQSVMEYREPVFPSIHHSGNIDPNNKFITMCYSLFLTQVCFCMLDILLSNYHVQEHSPKTCRWLRLSVRFDTFYEVQSFISVIILLPKQHILCQLYRFAPFLKIYLCVGFTFVSRSPKPALRVTVSKLCIYFLYTLRTTWSCHWNNVIFFSEHKLWGFSSHKFIPLLLPITWTQNLSELYSSLFPWRHRPSLTPIMGLLVITLVVLHGDCEWINSELNFSKYFP
jgi:hypothetical protein